MTYPEITNPAYEQPAACEQPEQQPAKVEITVTHDAVKELQRATIELSTVRSRRKQLDEELRREIYAEEKAGERYRKAFEATFVAGGKKVAP